MGRGRAEASRSSSRWSCSSFMRATHGAGESAAKQGDGEVVATEEDREGGEMRAERRRGGKRDEGADCAAVVADRAFQPGGRSGRFDRPDDPRQATRREKLLQALAPARRRWWEGTRWCAQQGPPEEKGWHGQRRSRSRGDSRPAGEPRNPARLAAAG